MHLLVCPHIFFVGEGELELPKKPDQDELHLHIRESGTTLISMNLYISTSQAKKTHILLAYTTLRPN